MPFGTRPDASAAVREVLGPGSAPLPMGSGTVAGSQDWVALNPLYRIDPAGQVFLSQTPAADWQERERQQALPALGSLGEWFRLTVVKNYWFRRVYFALLIDDAASYSVTGNVVFWLLGNRVLQLPFKRNASPASATVVTREDEAKGQWPFSYKRFFIGVDVTKSVLPIIDNAEIEHARDEILYHKGFSDLTNTWWYVARISPRHFTLACDAISVELLTESFTGNVGNGLFSCYMACLSQTHPFSS